jgi:myo-inositol-1(or 4)-monophosphatase
MNCEMRNLNELAKFASVVAKDAGKIQLEYFRSDGLDIQAKLNESDVVTSADKASEAYILGRIKETFPQDSILSEESGAESLNDDWRWVIDPLDGTTNFSSGLPLFSVSIGIEHKGETVVGVVYAPYLEEMFIAIKGEGATLNGNRIKCSGVNDMAKAVVATGFPVDKGTNPDNNLDNVSKVLPAIRGLRRLGSAAIDLCYVGAGYLSGYWELNLHRWDVSAGALVAREAGARVESFRDGRNISIVAAAPGIFNTLRQNLK